MTIGSYNFLIKPQNKITSEIILFILHTHNLNDKKSKIDHYSDKEALDFHIEGKSGKIEIHSSKLLTTKGICLQRILRELLLQLKR